VGAKTRQPELRDLFEAYSYFRPSGSLPRIHIALDHGLAETVQRTLLEQVDDVDKRRAVDGLPWRFRRDEFIGP
jgi:hypothetical protein